MRKTLLFLTVMVLGILSITAQNQDQQTFMFIDGDMLQIIDREQVQLDASIMLSDCTTLNPDGSFLTADGEQLRLKDGECLDVYGVKYRNERQYRYKMKKENKGLNQAQIANRYQNKFHYIKIGGGVFKIQNVAQNRIRKPFTLKNGIVLDPFGIYKTADQEEIRLKEGEFFNMNGVKFENPYQYRKMISKKNKNRKPTVSL